MSNETLVGYWFVSIENPEALDDSDVDPGLYRIGQITAKASDDVYVIKIHYEESSGKRHKYKGAEELIKVTDMMHWEFFPTAEVMKRGTAFVETEWE